MAGQAWGHQAFEALQRLNCAKSGDRLPSHAHYVHKVENTSHVFSSAMCKFVAILVYQGIIEQVEVFDRKKDAAGWLSHLAEESGAEHCADSIIWDTERKTAIYLGFTTR